MMNNRIFKLYKPVLALSRMFFLRKVSRAVHSIPPKTFSEQVRLDMRAIEDIWRNNKDKEVFNKHLWGCYVQSSELVTYAIDLINCACCRIIHPTHTNLIFDMIQSFSDYVNGNKVTFSPTADQKIDVLRSILWFKNYQLLQFACDVFKIRDQPVDCKKFIKDLIDQHKFEHAAYVVSALDLQNEFDVKEILYPLLLDGTVSLAITYTRNYPDLQLKAAKFLDGCVNLDITRIDSKSRKAFKTLSSLVKVYKIPVGDCPNLQLIRSRAALSHLVFRRMQQSISEEAWEDMIKNIIGDNEDLKRFLVQILIRKKDIKTAMKVAEKFNISDPDLFSKLNELSENSVNLDDQLEEFQLTCDVQEIFEDEYLKFSLTAEDIKLVNNKDDYISCINEICQNYNMIGIDSEWKPRFGLSRERLALIQLAGYNKVFIFDVLLLSECLEAQDWDMLLDNIFGNPNIVKLGCGIMTDVNMILDSIKGTKGKAVKFSHILDMALFYMKLQEVYPIEMKSDNEKDFTKGLSSLCDIVLGKPLSKEQRLYDWEKRPLDMKQLEYAALDAHCLLQVYDKLKEDAVLKNMNFEHLSKVAVVVTTSQWKPKRKFKGTRGGKEFHVHKLIPVGELKLVMDSTFENQAKELRKLGADVIVLNNTHSTDDVVEISRTERRIIVCSNEMYHKVKHRVTEGVCFNFQTNGDPLKVSYLLERFNASLSMKSIYSRCITCNSNDGMKLSSEDAEMLRKLCKTGDSINSIIENNLTSFSSELQENFNDIQKKSNIKIKISPENISSHGNGFGFLCKNCGDIS